MPENEKPISQRVWQMTNEILKLLPMECRVAIIEDIVKSDVRICIDNNGILDPICQAMATEAAEMEEYLFSKTEMEKFFGRYLRESPREYLPYGLTEEEKSDPELLRKLSSCIEKVEKKSCPESALKPDGKYDYEKCSVNPVAVCRVSVERSIENLIEK